MDRRQTVAVDAAVFTAVKISTPSSVNGANFARVLLRWREERRMLRGAPRRSAALRSSCSAREEDNCEYPLFSRSESRDTKGGVRGTRSQSKKNGERPTKKPDSSACTRSRVYGGIKEGAVALVRSLTTARRPVANQRRVATVHRPTADYRFSASRYRTAGEVHQVGPHPPSVVRRRTPAMLTAASITPPDHARAFLSGDIVHRGASRLARLSRKNGSCVARIIAA